MPWHRLIAQAIRIWVIACIAGVSGFSLWYLTDRDHPLRSDDPYLAAFFLAASGATGAASCLTLRSAFGKRTGSWSYAVILTVLCVALWVWSYFTPEGDQLVRLIAATWAVLGGPVLWLCTVRFPRWLALGLIIAGLLIVAGYIYVRAVVMGPPW